MPLDYSGSGKAFSKNVKAEMNAGKPQNQAVAIAYSAQGDRKPKEGGRFKKLSKYVKGRKNSAY